MINPGDVNIAIVGLGCKYPGSNSVQEYWENILALRQQFRQLPKDRLNLDYYGSDDPEQVDYTYLQKASVLNGYEFDRVKYRVSKSTFEQTDMAHWLALDVAADALKDAGFENGEGLDRQRVGVILGNSLNGEFTRANIMRLRWPYVQKVLQSTMAGLNYTDEQIADMLARTETTYKAPFPEPDADTLAGGLSNTIAGRICNYFDFNGGGFTVDGACSSSLLSTAIGCNGIMNGELDVVLVGGVDLSIDPFEIIGFTRNGALARNEMEVYSSKSQGFWPGEGCGMVVLMNETLAREKGLEIYGVIRGWGISSDGKGGITRPKPQTQRKAIELAYQKAGYGVDTVAMFEGHGTGTPLGDKVELEALISALKGANKQNKAATLGSVKHLIGHTKAAAGVAGIIKACLAIKNNVIPPSRPNSPHELLTENADIIGLSSAPQAYRGSVPMRAAVSSMGFGGINVHITMESQNEGRASKRLSPQVTKLSNSNRDYEIVSLGASSRQGLLNQVEKWLKIIPDVSRAELIDLAATNNANFKPSGNWKAAIVAKTPDLLVKKMNVLKDWLNAGEDAKTDMKEGIFFDSTGKKARIGFLFPGQGAPISKTDGAFAPFVRDILRNNCKDVTFAGRVADTSVAQPVIVERSLRAAELMAHFGVTAELAIGHSLGEISALSWAGALDAVDAKEIARKRGVAMSEGETDPGLLMAIKCKEGQINDFVSGEGPWITGYNGRDNYVIGGSASMITKAEEQAVNAGFPNTRLKVSHAFHTPFMKAAAKRFGKYVNGFEWEEIDQTVISTVTGQSIKEDTCLTKHLLSQVESPVLFTQAIEKAAADIDLFIEVGPGSALTKSLHHTPDIKVIPTEYGANSIQAFLKALACAYVNGAPVAFPELSAGRYYRPTSLEGWKLNVLISPCEKVQVDTTPLPLRKTAVPGPVVNGQPTAIPSFAPGKLNAVGVLKHLKELISNKTEIPVEVIGDKDRIMSELHLNSLAITEIISLATKVFKKDHKTFSAASLLANADASIEDVSREIFRGGQGKATAVNKVNAIDLYDRVENWTHGFHRIMTTKNQPNIKTKNGATELHFLGNEILVDKYKSTLQSNQPDNLGQVALYFSAGDDSAKGVEHFLKFVQTSLALPYHVIALVELDTPDNEQGLAPVFRTLQLEHPGLVVLRLNLSSDLSNLEDTLLSELAVSTKYREVFYDAEGIRKESEFTTYFPETRDIVKSISPNDVILATGGGKGITFASAQHLASLTGARLILLGRSSAGTSPELDGNLQLLREQGIKHEYHAADVMNETAVATAIQTAEKNLGKVSIILHGAGINRPKVLSVLQVEDFVATEAIKVQGLKNVCAALDLKQLKLLVGYGSIIGQSGMQGNADYALANNKMANQIRALDEQLTGCRCLTLEWSVWEETGMGVSLGSLDGLKSRGVWPIPVKAGLRMLQDHISDTAPGRPQRIVIGGRYGNIPTFRHARKKLSAGRFLGKTLDATPCVELVTDVSINRADDIFLNNHVFEGQYIFPTVMIMEGIAQCCRAVGGEFAQLSFKDFEIEKSIFIPKEGANIVRFIITRTGKNEFSATVRSEDSNFEVDCFSTRVLTSSIDVPAKHRIKKLKKLPIEVGGEFYDELLFHHGPFRRIEAFERVSAGTSQALVGEVFSGKWFGDYVNDELLLGDAGLNDAAIHCHQVCRPGFNLLPTRVDQVNFYQFVTSGPLRIHTNELREVGNETVIDVTIVDEKGQVVQTWIGLSLTKVSGTSFTGVWNPVLLNAYVEYQLRTVITESGTTFPAKVFADKLNALIRTGEPLAIQGEGFEVRLQPGVNAPTAPHEQLIKLSGTEGDLLLSIQATVPV